VIVSERRPGMPIEPLRDLHASDIDMAGGSGGAPRRSGPKAGGSGAADISDVDFGKTDISGRRRVPTEPGLAAVEASDVRSHARAEAKGVTGSASHDIVKIAVQGEYRYAMAGLVLGLATILGGVVLGLHGIAGKTSWTAKLLGLESNLTDAPPGVVLFIVGVFLIYATRPKVKLEKLRG